MESGNPLRLSLQYIYILAATDHVAIAAVTDLEKVQCSRSARRFAAGKPCSVAPASSSIAATSVAAVAPVGAIPCERLQWGGGSLVLLTWCCVLLTYRDRQYSYHGD